MFFTFNHVCFFRYVVFLFLSYCFEALFYIDNVKNVIVMGATVVNVTTSVMAMSGLVDGQVHVMWVVPGEVMVRPRWTVPTVWTWRDVAGRGGT